MKELDHLLDQFISQHGPTLDQSEAELFENLLAMEDDRLWACLLRQETTQDKAMDSLLEKIRVPSKS